MRVVLVSPYLPARDGIADYTAVLRQGLLDHGEDVAVVAARRDAAAPSEVLCAVPDRAQAAAATAAVVAHRPDVVHLQFATAAFGTRTAALLRWLPALGATGAQRVVTCHEVTRDLALLRTVGVRLYRRLAGWADVVVVHTEAAREALVEIGVDPGVIRRIPHVEPALPAETTTPDELTQRYGVAGARILLAFGFVHVDKGLPELVRALRLLLDSEGESVADVRLVVAGGVRRRVGAFRVFEANDRRHLRQVRGLVRRLGLTDRVVVTGYVPGGEVAPWLRSASAVVLPYRRIEQSGVASLAAAAAAPVLASTVGGLAEDADTLAGTFPPRDPQRLAEALHRHLTSPVPVRPRTTGGRSVGEVVEATVAAYGSGSRKEASYVAAG